MNHIDSALKECHLSGSGAIASTDGHVCMAFGVPEWNRSLLFHQAFFGACRCKVNAQDRQVQYIFLGTGITHWHFCCVRKEAPFVRDDASR